MSSTLCHWHFLPHPYKFRAKYNLFLLFMVFLHVSMFAGVRLSEKQRVVADCKVPLQVSLLCYSRNCKAWAGFIIKESLDQRYLLQNGQKWQNLWLHAVYFSLLFMYLGTSASSIMTSHCNFHNLPSPLTPAALIALPSDRKYIISAVFWKTPHPNTTQNRKQSHLLHLHLTNCRKHRVTSTFIYQNLCLELPKTGKNVHLFLQVLSDKNSSLTKILLDSWRRESEFA